MSSTPLLSYTESNEGSNQIMPPVRERLRRFFNTKAFHYLILLLVSLDVGCLFADIVINLLTCGNKTHGSEAALKVLEYASLVFSSLFMLELSASVWAFGRRYFASKFHIFDGLVIITSFVFELALQGVTEEVASLIVILRLLRVVKIVDELSVGAEEQMKQLEDRLAQSEKECNGLKEELQRLRLQREIP
ncbi:hypothetical protein BS50DRAFT_576624 [Corynespora cassiicola Philippines]|uniref:Voltage-gated hydrogen channel 1 n=1 Tax=Corynespora cassiicola Philippines TaxID=1448308 RepID=A0A2T2NEY1_CORCC|nr:hypothetical protein BS50DRAFT_576624 [Corynespora cassiicola Philippines]